MTVAASDSMQRSASTFCISGWSTSSLPNAERCAAWWVACATPCAHARGRAEHAVEARVVDHLDDRRHAAALLADHPRPGAVELDLAGGVGAVAELVLQALDAEAVAAAVGQDARQQEARQPAVGLREHQERVAHRRRAEPLVAGELVLGARSAAVQRRARPWCWRARPSRPASRSSPCRTARRPCRPAGTRRGSYAVEVSRGSHSAASSGVARSAGTRRVGHRDRAARARPRPGPSP